MVTERPARAVGRTSTGEPSEPELPGLGAHCRSPRARAAIRYQATTRIRDIDQAKTRDASRLLASSTTPSPTSLGHRHPGAGGTCRGSLGPRACRRSAALPSGAA